MARHLSHFAVVAEEEHFQRAAARLNLSQPALSRRIRALEERLGVGLFERLPNGARLTEGGRHLHKEVRRIMADLSRAVDRTRAIAAGEAGLLRVGFNETSVQQNVVTQVLRVYKAQFPRVELQLIPMDSAAQIAALEREELEAGFLYRPAEESPAFAWHEILVQTFALALPAGHKLLARKTIRLADLKRENFIWQARKQWPLVYDRMIAGCQAGGLSPNIVMEVLGTEGMLSLVGAGLGIGFIRASQWIPEGIVLRHVDDFVVPLYLDFVWRRDDTTPSLLRFVETVERLVAGKEIG